MELTVSVESKDPKLARNVTTNLIKNINTRAPQTFEIKQHEPPTPKNVAGGSILESIFTIVVSQNIIGKLLDIVKLWMETNKSKREAQETSIKVEYKTTDGKTEKVALTNIKDAEVLKGKLEILLANSK